MKTYILVVSAYSENYRVSVKSTSVSTEFMLVVR